MTERLSTVASRAGLPMLLVALLAIGAALVALAIPLPAGIAWLSAVTGAAAVLCGVGLALHAALRRPESLRSTTRAEITRPAQEVGTAALPATERWG
jgi:hypothetical protein